MRYSNIHRGRFLDRPNRFIAHADLNGTIYTCHVKNTGRCKELLLPGCTVFLEFSDNSARKTPCDLVAVQKGVRLINIDSAAPNAVAKEWLLRGGLGFAPDLLRPECSYGDSRFDYYLEYGDHRAFLEVKGVTLEEDGVVRFPDAPTERGVKHIRGLCNAVRNGYDAYILFIIQMTDIKHFEPNRATHPAFAEALQTAEAAGVQILAIDCDVSETGITAGKTVEVRL